MKLKCKARRYSSLFSCNSESHITNYFSFKLSIDVEKNPGPTQSKTDSHETIINKVILTILRLKFLKTRAPCAIGTSLPDL